MIAQRRFLRKKEREKIKKLLRKRGLTYRDIAELLGKSKVTIRNVINGYTYSYSLAEKIEKILGVEGLFPYLTEKREMERKRRLAIEVARKNLEGVK